METKQQKRHGAKIQFSSLKLPELWERLGLQQPLLEPMTLQDPSYFEDDESRMAYEAFKKDFCLEKTPQQDLEIIPSDKGGVFIWSLLKEESKHCPKEKVSSKKLLFMDNLLRTIRMKAKACYGSSNFSERDFEDIVLYLEKKKLIAYRDGEIRTTQHFMDLFHEKYKAWLVL